MVESLQLADGGVRLGGVRDLERPDAFGSGAIDVVGSDARKRQPCVLYPATACSISGPESKDVLERADRSAGFQAQPAARLVSQQTRRAAKVLPSQVVPWRRLVAGNCTVQQAVCVGQGALAGRAVVGERVPVSLA